MRRWLARLSAALVPCALLAAGFWLLVLRVPPAPDPSHVAFAIEEVTIVDPMLDRRAGARIEVSEGKLGLGASAAALPVLAEYRGAFVLPGFIDMHTHLPVDNLLKLTQHYGLLHLAHGVTSIRSAGDLDGTADPAARALIAQGRPFPNLVSCGPFVSRGKRVWPNTIVLERPEDAARLVERIAEGGHGCVKAYEGLTPELIGAVVAAADARGLHVIGHVPVEITLERSGIPDVQHFFGVPEPSSLGGEAVTHRNGDWSGVTEERLDAVEAFILAKGIRNTPTVATLEGFQGLADPAPAAAISRGLLPSFFADIVWNTRTGLPVYRGLERERFAEARQALALKQRLARRLSERGATLHIGTDVGQPFTAPGWSFWREMRLFEQAGIAPEQVLAYATHVAGSSLGNGAGRLAEGARADLLVFREDPTKSLGALDSLQAVVLGGRLYRRQDLERALRRSLEHYETWPLRVLARGAAQRAVDEAARNF